MSDTPDMLIARYLNGTADAGDVHRLDELVRTDPTVRRELFLASVLDSHLSECLASCDEVEPEPGRVLGWRAGIALAAAAMLLLTVGAATMLMGRYPDPEVSGAYHVVGGGPVCRGAVIVAGSGGARVTLGGYCKVSLDAGGSLQIAGEKLAEAVVLHQGRATCQTDRDVGTFAVRSDVGSVAATGTQFAVRMIDDQGDSDMFGKRMAINVLTGAVLVSGVWGEMSLQAGENATTPPPETVLRKIVADVNPPAPQQKKITALLDSERVKTWRYKHNITMRRELFDIAHKVLSTTMPKIMPKKVAPKIQAIRRKLRAGPPKPADIARIRLAMQQRTRVIMMNVIHKTADELSDKAAGDDQLIAALLARQVRAELPADKIAAFDAALKTAKIVDTEANYFARAKKRVEKAMAAYDPDITGIINPKTGKITVTDEQLGVTIKDVESDKRIAGKLSSILAREDLPTATRKKITVLLSSGKVEAQRAAAYSSIRRQALNAARQRLQSGMPKAMPDKVQKKVMAIRTRVKAQGPPDADELAGMQKAASARARTVMMHVLHQAADTAAARAVKDDNITAAAVAASIRTKLTDAQIKSFNAALARGGIDGDVKKYLAHACKRIDAAIASYDPDLSEIVDPKTGKLIEKAK